MKGTSHLLRIRLIAEHEGLSVRHIEIRIGASNGTLNRALAKKTDISSKWLVKIARTFPGYSPEWLLTGKGPMLKKGTAPENEHPPIQEPQIYKTCTQMKHENYIQRISQLVEREGITLGELERRIGASKGVISRAFNNGTEIQGKWLAAIADIFPRYSMDWLLAGRGPVFREEVSRMPDASAACPQDKETVFSQMAAAIPSFRGEGFLHRVTGESMEPHLRNGDMLVCRHIPLHQRFFQWNEIYCLETPQGRLVKRVRPGADKEHILAVSDNPDFPPVEIPVDLLTGTAIVLGVVSCR